MDLKMSLDDLAVVFIKISEALAHCATIGVVHSDVKTDNVLLTHTEVEMDGERVLKITDVKLCDFGIASTVDKATGWAKKKIASIVDKATGWAKKKGGNEWFSPDEDEVNMLPFAFDIFGLGRTLLDVLDEREHKKFNRPFLMVMKLRNRRRLFMDLVEKWQHPFPEKRPNLYRVVEDLHCYMRKGGSAPTACDYTVPEAPAGGLHASPSETNLLEATTPKKKLSSSISVTNLSMAGNADLSNSISAASLVTEAPAQTKPMGGLSKCFAASALLTSRCDSSPCLNGMVPAETTPASSTVSGARGVPESRLPTIFSLDLTPRLGSITTASPKPLAAIPPLSITAMSPITQTIGFGADAVKFQISEPRVAHIELPTSPNVQPVHDGASSYRSQWEKWAAANNGPCTYACCTTSPMGRSCPRSSPRVPPASHQGFQLGHCQKHRNPCELAPTWATISAGWQPSSIF
eukprot:gene1213-32554_t